MLRNLAFINYKRIVTFPDKYIQNEYENSSIMLNVEILQTIPERTHFLSPPPAPHHLKVTS